MIEVVAVGVPLIAIIAGILFSRQDTASLRSEIQTSRSDMNNEFQLLRGNTSNEIQVLRTETGNELHEMRSEIHNRFDSIQRDMREFYATQARHEIRLQRVERPIKE